MEEVSAHVHPRPIVPDVLSRQHEHQSGLMWSGDHETTAPRRMVELIDGTGQLSMATLGGARQIGGALVLVQIWAWSRILALRPPPITDIQVDPLAPVGAICLYGSLILTTSMLQELNDMASVTITQRCMVFIGGTLGCTPSQHDIQQTFPVQPSCRRLREHVPERDARGVKRGARAQPGRGAGGGRPLVPPFSHRHEHVDTGHVEVERRKGSGGGQPTVDPFDSPNLDIPPFYLV
ncbi:hypothetical protein M9H77_27005 [Catharanthus roseus]|uniref:Uncharacterized protein n=1 Tax=Catharanthus roseus TaxID=4058 RepID=A0ACC0ABA7_CATRO|nr:hypothetical protein M9H77_27005 [Catharanthus roseus]